MPFSSVIAPHNRGIGGIVGLQPYEHACFNSAEGVGRAAGLYELDPWCTSYREAAEVANTLAEKNATVLAIPQSNQVRPQLRPDLRLVAGRGNVSVADVVGFSVHLDPSTGNSSASILPLNTSLAWRKASNLSSLDPSVFEGSSTDQCSRTLAFGKNGQDSFASSQTVIT